MQLRRRSRSSRTVSASPANRMGSRQWPAISPSTRRGEIWRSSTGRSVTRRVWCGWAASRGTYRRFARRDQWKRGSSSSRRLATSPAHEGAAMNSKYSRFSVTGLDAHQQAIIPISACAAAGNMSALDQALNQGLDAGLSVAVVREILVQVYAYAGFPRSLNALSELMRAAQARRQRGIQDEAGREPGRPIPKGYALLAAGTANQTRLAGGPVSEPLFYFAPQANEYLRTHLFGDIFERDNLDWQIRELATVSMLAAMSGVEPQLQSHIGISMNIGLRPEQL